MKKNLTNPTLDKGVKELDRLSNLYYKSRDEKSRTMVPVDKEVGCSSTSGFGGGTTPLRK